MKVRFVFLLLTVLVANSSYSQNLKQDQRYPGYFINAKNDSIHGFILNKNKLDNQKTTEYSNDSKAEKIKLNLIPDQIQGFRIDTLEYRVIEYGEADPLPYHFLLLLEDGMLQLYQYFFMRGDEYVTSGYGTRPATGYDEQYLLWEFIIMKNNKLFVIASQNSLMKQCEEVFQENAELLSKILAKEKGCRYADLTEIVKAFNRQ